MTEKENLESKDRVSKKLSESKTFQLMNKFNEKAILYPSAYIDIKSPKRDLAINKALDSKQKDGTTLYDYHMKFSPSVNSFGASVVLICNENAVSYMIDEVAEFINALNVFYKKIQQANNVQELQQYYKEFKLKPKELVDSLIYELGNYSELYGFELNKRDIATKLKEKINN